NRLSHCLSLMSAWFGLASPWITLIRSYTTRRSQPMMRSRLRKPTSKSITAVLWPRRARPAAKLALVVVLPTPPLPEVTTTILAMCSRISVKVEGLSEAAQSALNQRLDDEFFPIQANLRWFAPHVVSQLGFGGAVNAGYRHQLGF